MADIIDRAREYIAKHSEYSEVFGHTFVTVDTLTAMVEFAEQETKKLEAEKDKAWWEGFDTCKAKAGEANVKLSDENNLLKAQIEKMKKYGKLLQDICDVMGNDPYMVWRGLEQRVLTLWDESEEEEGLKMADDILERLLKISAIDWAEIEKWEIKENAR